MSLFRWSPRIAQYPSLGKIPPSSWEKESRYPGRERNSEPALLFRRRLTCTTQRSGCLYCGSSRYSTTCMRTLLPCSLLLARDTHSSLSPMGSDGFSGLDGNTHRHDSGLSTASVSNEPAGEYHRGLYYDPCKRFPDLRSASGRAGPAACFCRVPVLRND
jgi:hypothetical protein